MRFRTDQDARLTKAELFVYEMSAEVNQLADFEEGSWCNIGVRQQEVPRWAAALLWLRQQRLHPRYIALRRGQFLM